MDIYALFFYSSLPLCKVHFTPYQDWSSCKYDSILSLEWTLLIDLIGCHRLCIHTYISCVYTCPVYIAGSCFGLDFQRGSQVGVCDNINCISSPGQFSNNGSYLHHYPGVIYLLPSIVVCMWEKAKEILTIHLLLLGFEFDDLVFDFSELPLHRCWLLNIRLFFTLRHSWFKEDNGISWISTWFDSTSKRSLS